MIRQRNNNKWPTTTTGQWLATITITTTSLTRARYAYASWVLLLYFSPNFFFSTNKYLWLDWYHDKWTTSSTSTGQWAATTALNHHMMTSALFFFSYFFTLLKDFFTTRLHGNHDDDEQMGQEWMDAAPLLITLYISPCHYIGIDMLLLPTVPNTAYESWPTST